MGQAKTYRYLPAALPQPQKKKKAVMPLSFPLTIIQYCNDNVAINLVKDSVRVPMPFSALVWASP